jgi:NifU-like protein involved in Fe-S cluster formation
MELQPFACACPGCVARHASTMLTFDAVVKAVDKIEAKRKQAAE